MGQKLPSAMQVILDVSGQLLHDLILLSTFEINNFLHRFQVKKHNSRAMSRICAALLQKYFEIWYIQG